MHVLPLLVLKQCTPAAKWHCLSTSSGSTSVSVFSQKGGSPFQAYVLRLVAEWNCVAARRGGEYREAKGQSATKVNSIRPGVSASLLPSGEAQTRSTWLPSKRKFAKAPSIVQRWPGSQAWPSGPRPRLSTNSSHCSPPRRRCRSKHDSSRVGQARLCGRRPTGTVDEPDSTTAVGWVKPGSAGADPLWPVSPTRQRGLVVGVREPPLLARRANGLAGPTQQVSPCPTQMISPAPSR